MGFNVMKKNCSWLNTSRNVLDEYTQQLMITNIEDHYLERSDNEEGDKDSSTQCKYLEI